MGQPLVFLRASIWRGCLADFSLTGVVSGGSAQAVNTQGLILWVDIVDLAENMFPDTTENISALLRDLEGA